MEKSGNEEILTERYVLRPIRADDLPDIWPHVSDPEISRDMSWAPHSDPDETLCFLKRLESDRASDRGYTWTIRTKTHGDFCGIFSLIAVQRSHRALTYDRAELAYWCARRWQRCGVMSEVGTVVISHAFANLGINRLVVSHHVGNVASERLIQKLGFTCIGRERQAFRKNGRWIDTRYYELLRSDFSTRTHKTSP